MKPCSSLLRTKTGVASIVTLNKHNATMTANPESLILMVDCSIERHSGSTYPPLARVRMKILCESIQVVRYAKSKRTESGHLPRIVFLSQKVSTPFCFD